MNSFKCSHLIIFEFFLTVSRLNCCSICLILLRNSKSSYILQSVPLFLSEDPGSIPRPVNLVLFEYFIILIRKLVSNELG